MPRGKTKRRLSPRERRLLEHAYLARCALERLYQVALGSDLPPTQPALVHARATLERTRVTFDQEMELVGRAILEGMDSR